MILVQQIILEWEKKCRAGSSASKRRGFPQSAMLPEDFFGFTPMGYHPVHRKIVKQEPDGFFVKNDEQQIVKYEKAQRLYIEPMEIIPSLDGGCEVRYLRDRYNDSEPFHTEYDPTFSKYIPSNKRVLELRPNDYGRTLCNGRFVDWEAGIWWYELNIINILVCPNDTHSHDAFITKEPNKFFRQMEQLY